MALACLDAAACPGRPDSRIDSVQIGAISVAEMKNCLRFCREALA